MVGYLRHSRATGWICGVMALWSALQDSEHCAQCSLLPSGDQEELRPLHRLFSSLQFSCSCSRKSSAASLPNNGRSTPAFTQHSGSGIALSLLLLCRKRCECLLPEHIFLSKAHILQLSPLLGDCQRLSSGGSAARVAPRGRLVGTGGGHVTFSLSIVGL